MSTKFLSPGWRMPRNANQSKQASYSLHFTPGSVTNVNLGDALSFFIGSFSASMWVKSPDNGKEFFSRYISANGVGNFRIGCGANSGATANTVSLMTKNFLLSGSTDIRDGNWHHVCVTMDAISSTQYTRTIYVDGSQDAQDTVTLATYVSTSSSYGLNLGCNFQNNGHTLVDMSEVSIFDYALSPSQVTTLYGDSTNGSGNPMALPNPPKAYYPLGTSAWNGEYLAENNAIGDYVFDFIPNNYINLNSDILFNTNQGFSFSSWVNLDSYSDPYPYLANLKTNVTDGIGIFISNNSSYAGVNVGSTDSSITKGRTTGDISSTFLNSWNNVVVTYNGNGANTLSNFSIYVNGSPVTLTSTGTFGTMPNTANNIGRRSNSYHYLDGKMSNVQIWNKELIDSEIETLYNYGSPIQTLANIPQNSNLKAWYKLDASEVYNSSTTEWSIDNNQNPSAYPSSLDFNSSSNDFIQINNGSSLTNGFSQLTVSIWANFSSLSTRMGLLTKDIINQRSFDFRFLNSSGVNFLVSTDGINNSQTLYYPSSSITTGVWYNFVGTYDGSKLSLYVNGSLIDDTITLTGNLPNTTSNLYVGTRGYVTSDSFNGLLSNAQIFNTALTDGTGGTLNQIETLYNNGTPLSDMSSFTSLVSWWKLNNTTTGIEDSKGSNNGTNNGATEYPGFVNKLVGDSSGMSQANLIQSDLQTVAPYSKYAMSFDGIDGTMLLGTTPIVTGVFTISMWIKRTSTSSPESAPTQNLISKDQVSSNRVYSAFLNTSTGILSFWVSSSGAYNSALRVNTSTAINDTEWHNVVFINNGDNINNQVYIDGAEASYADQGTGVSSLHSSTTNLTACGSDYYALANAYCSMSNISMWTSAFSSFQVREIYNEGLPSNLNLHSSIGSIASWWQCGENSSFDGSNWTCINEVASNNGVTRSTPVGALVNGVGTTANGVSSGMSEGNLVGDAPYSTANAISTNMVVTSRVTGSGNTP